MQQLVSLRFLDRHYPASTVVRASPPPWRPGLAPHGVPVGACTPPTGLPVLPRLPSSIHADATTPAETVRCICRLSSRPSSAFPLPWEGRLPHYSFRGLLSVRSRSGLYGRWTARGGPLTPECFDLHRYLRKSLWLLPAGSDSCCVGFAPTEKTRLSTAHQGDEL